MMIRCLLDKIHRAVAPGVRGLPLILGMALLFATFFVARLEAAAISAVTLEPGRIQLRFDGPVESVSTFLMEEPDRLAIDVGGATAGNGGVPVGPFASIRHGQFDPRTARVVLGLAQPVIITSGQFARDGRTLTLAYAITGKEAFRKALAQGRKYYAPPLVIAGLASPPPPAAATPAQPAPTYSSQGKRKVSVPLAPPRKSGASRLPPVLGGGLGRPLVVIDAGHGGHDPGAPSVVEGKHEKNATLPIALALRDALLASGKVRVAMTRDDDTFLVLQERREIARRLKADLFISIHADSAANASAKGASVYTLSEIASDKVAAQLAIKENRADILNGVDLGGEASDISSILIDLTQRETMNISSVFAGQLQREMASNVAMRTRYHQFANLAVLKAPDVPSVLIETGYMSNYDDATFLFSTEGQQRIAAAIHRAVEAHFARRLAQR